MIKRSDGPQILVLFEYELSIHIGVSINVGPQLLDSWMLAVALFQETSIQGIFPVFPSYIYIGAMYVYIYIHDIEIQSPGFLKHVHLVQSQICVTTQQKDCFWQVFKARGMGLVMCSNWFLLVNIIRVYYGLQMFIVSCTGLIAELTV